VSLDKIQICIEEEREVKFQFSDGSSPLYIYNKSNEMQEYSRIHNKPLY